MDVHSDRRELDGKLWRELSQQVIAEVKGFIGMGVYVLLFILRIRNRKRYDYRSFFRRFMVHRTIVRP